MHTEPCVPDQQYLLGESQEGGWRRLGRYWESRVAGAVGSGAVIMRDARVCGHVCAGNVLAMGRHHREERGRDG